MATRVINREQGPRSFRSKAGTVLLAPGENLVADAKWKAVTQQFDVKRLEQAGAIEVSGHQADAPPAEGESRVTRGDVPLAYQGGLPGQGGEDISRRTAEEESTEGSTEESGTRRRRRTTSE